MKLKNGSTKLDTLKAQIARLQHQNELLTTQLNLLKEVMRKD
jgi:chaperonin cofactor prefoldin